VDRPTASWTDDSAAAATQMDPMTTGALDVVMRERSG